MAKESSKKPVPNAADVPSVAPLVEAVGRAKARVQSAAESATTDGVLTKSEPAYRAARKRLKRAQRRLRGELRRIPPAPPVVEEPTAAAGEAAPAAEAAAPEAAEAPAD